MKDLNFFEPYLEKRQFKMNLSLVLYAFIGLYCVYTVFTGLSNQYKIKLLRNDVHALQEIAENPTTLKKVDEIKKKGEEVNTFETEVNKIKEMDRVVEASNIIGEDFLRLITSKMPEDIFFNSLNLNNSDIQISGISKDKWSVAEFSKGLASIDEVDDIFVSNITRSEDHYNFMLVISLKEVSANAEDAD